jgi:hypothetical protein
VGDVDDVEIVEDGDRGAPSQVVDHFLQKWLQDDFGVDGAQIPRADGQDLGP